MYTTLSSSLKITKLTKKPTAAPFPEGGKLSQIQTCATPMDHMLQHQWYYEGTDAGPVEIDVYSGGDVMAAYEEIKKESLTAKTWRPKGQEVDGWKKNPSGFPNQNEYENIEACGMTLNGQKAAWVQSGFLVVLTAIQGGKALSDYADGVWGVMNAASMEK
jgi:hypothetical protein